MIAVENLHKQYGHRIAVHDLSFEARDGEITGLLGSNGVGKSTTLRMIAGILRPQSGNIRITGDRDALGALLDHTGLYSRLTARENIEYFGRLRRVPQLAQRVNGLLAHLDLSAIANERVGGFSLGQRVKVALGRALVHHPRNLLLDEPTNGLDIPTVRSLRQLLGDMRSAGHCIVLSSHVLGEVTALCDRIVMIARGVVVAQGTPGELCRQTACSSLEEAYLQLTNSPAVPAC